MPFDTPYLHLPRTGALGASNRRPHTNAFALAYSDAPAEPVAHRRPDEFEPHARSLARTDTGTEFEPKPNVSTLARAHTNTNTVSEPEPNSVTLVRTNRTPDGLARAYECALGLTDGGPNTRAHCGAKPISNASAIRRTNTISDSPVHAGHLQRPQPARGRVLCL